MCCIAHTAGARAAAASAGADGGWNSDTGREFRHGQRHAQPRIPNCKRRCDACEEFPEASAIVPRHGLVRISKANYPICPAHPPHLPLPLTGRLLHGIRTELPSGTATHPTTTKAPSQCRAGPETPRRCSSVIPVPSTVASLQEWCRLGPPPTPPPLFTVLGGASCMAWQHRGAQPCMHRRKASPRRKNQQMMTYRFIHHCRTGQQSAQAWKHRSWSSHPVRGRK